MVQADFQSLGEYLRLQNPYSTRPHLPPKLGPNGGPGVLTVDDKNTADPWVLTWDFREPADAPDGSFQANDVVNYRIARAVVVSTWYAWEAESPPCGPERMLYANILIGYTPPHPVKSFSSYRSFVDDPDGHGDGGYDKLGEIVARRFPFSPQPSLVSEVDAEGNLSDVVTAVSFVANKSNASGDVYQGSGKLMTLPQRQQCLYWDGPKRTGSLAAEPTPSSVLAGPFGGDGLSNYQITKAFRLRYRFMDGGTAHEGMILLGFNGSGDG